MLFRGWCLRRQRHDLKLVVILRRNCSLSQLALFCIPLFFFAFVGAQSLVRIKIRSLIECSEFHLTGIGVTGINRSMLKIAKKMIWYPVR